MRILPRAKDVQLDVELLKLSDAEDSSMEEENVAVSNSSHMGAMGITNAPTEQVQTLPGVSAESPLPEAVQMMLKRMEDRIKLAEEKTEAEIRRAEERSDAKIKKVKEEA